jgi:hypothetical protein
MGNLAFKRYESLADIGRVLDEINFETGRNFKLFIYTKTIGEEAQKAFEGIQSIEHCGFVTGEEFEQTLHEADGLVHVESFSPECIERVKHSVYTKIADSLGSGVPLLAYGPENVASMKYLDESQASFLAINQTAVCLALQSVLSIENRREMSRTALNIARKNHDKHRNSMILRDLMQKIFDRCST